MSSELPEGWRRVELRDIAKLSMGETLLTKNLTGDGIPVFSANTDEGPWGYTSKNRRRLRRGDIVIGARGSIGFPRRPEFDAFTCTQTTIAVEPNLASVDGEYLHQALRAADILGIASQQAVPMLTIGSLSPLEVALPPLDEQRRIAEVLRSVDSAIAANQSALDAARRTVEALACEIAANAPDTRTVADFGRVVTGGTPSPKKAELWGGDLPFVTPGDLDDEHISVRSAARTLNAVEPHGAKVLPPNSVLVTCIGSTVGKVAISRRQCATNQQINAVCCDPDLSGYVYLACLAAYDAIVANAGKQAVPIINKSRFSQIDLPCFPRDRMLEISETVDALDDEREGSATALARLTALKTALMADLLSGRVRVTA
jgi:type I restriction enzyme S subunit